MGHDVRIKVVFDYECPLLEPRILTNPHMIQTGHIWFFQLAVCFWVLGLPLFEGMSAGQNIQWRMTVTEDYISDNPPHSTPSSHHQLSWLWTPGQKRVETR